MAQIDRTNYPNPSPIVDAAIEFYNVLDTFCTSKGYELTTKEMPTKSSKSVVVQFKKGNSVVLNQTLTNTVKDVNFIITFNFLTKNPGTVENELKYFAAEGEMNELMVANSTLNGKCMGIMMANVSMEDEDYINDNRVMRFTIPVRVDMGS